MNRKTRSGDWLEQKFLTWQMEVGKKQTIRQLAAYLGVNENLLARWLRGQMVPRDDNVVKIANKLGAEYYDVLGWTRPEIKENNIKDK